MNVKESSIFGELTHVNNGEQDNGISWHVDVRGHIKNNSCRRFDMLDLLQLLGWPPDFWPKRKK